MRKLRTSVLALTTVASLALGGTAVATAAEAPQSISKDSKGSSQDNKGSFDKVQGSSAKKDDTQDNKGSSKDNKGSSKQGDTQDNNGGSLNKDKGWVPGHSFGSTLQTDYVPAWAKVWIAVLTVVSIVTAGLFAAPGITALRAHHIIP